MRKRSIAASVTLILGSLSAAINAAIPVEQIEAYGNPPTDTQYTPVNFNGQPTITLAQFDQGGTFPNLTFQALTSTSSGYSGTFFDHANAVGQAMYGAGTVAYPYVVNPGVTNVYCDAYDRFLISVVKTQNAPGAGPIPSTFPLGVKVVNNSYVVNFTATSANIDAYRRIDSMITQQDLTFVAGAQSSDANGTYVLDWSSFDSLVASGSSQTFNPAIGPGKQHADLFRQGDASFAAAFVSQYATGLFGQAQSANQTNAIHTVVNRSLLMAGADKAVYTRQTANNLDLTHGAGEPNYDTSLAILQSGEKTIQTVTGGNVAGTLATSQDGWMYGTVSAGSQNAVLFQASKTITGLTASLNWNVTSATSGTSINTSTGSLQFPNLTLEVRAVTYNAGTGKYALGANQSNAMLHSAATGDNVQYLYNTASLPAGTYAFLIGGDPALAASVGFSYTLSGSFATQWNNSAGSSWGTASNWTSGPADGRAAVANFLSSPGLAVPGTITLDANRTVGIINFSNVNGYVIAAGTGGTLIVDDSSDSSGIANPQINVTTGNHTIAAPMALTNGVNVTVAGASAITLAGSISGSGAMVKSGAGTVSLNGVVSLGSFEVQAGTATLGPAGSFAVGAISVDANTILNFAASTSSGILLRNLPVQLNAAAGGTLVMAASASTTNRQLLLSAGGLSLAGSLGNWTAKLDSNNNDLDLAGASLATVADQIKQGFNGGKWNGSAGISSSSAASNSAHLTALGVIQNNQSGTALFTASNMFDTNVPGASDILIKYTYIGDANLDGRVDGSDYSRIDNGYLLALTGWYNGDFNYDGTVNGSDYTLIDNAFNIQGTAIAASINPAYPVNLISTVAVPEPSFGGICGTIGLLHLCRRKPGQCFPALHKPTDRPA